MSDDKRHLKLLQALLDVSGNPQLIAATASLTGLTRKQRKYLAAPLVVPSAHWADILPDWIKPAVYKDRLELVFDEHERGIEGELATEIEVMAYLHLMSLESPITTDATRMFMWCSCRSLVKHKQKQSETEVWEMLAVEPVVLSLDERIRQLEDLQRRLRSIAVRGAK